MAEGTYYKIARLDSDDSVYVSDERLDAEGAREHLAVEHVLHVMGGWHVTPCRCGGGFLAVKRDLRRAIHLIPEDEAEQFLKDWESDENEIETLALALGLLQPASHKDGLEVVI